MAKIVFKKRSHTFNRIVSYGCSYTAGVELSDADFIPNADELKRQMGVIPFNKKYSNILLTKDAINENNKRSWAGQLSKRFKVAHHNRAQGGSSLEDSIYRMRSDLVEKKLLKTDLVVLGITTPQRWHSIGKDGSIENNLVSEMTDNSSSRAFLHVYDDYKLLHLHLTYLEQFITELENAKIAYFMFEMLEKEFYGLYKRVVKKLVYEPELLEVINWRVKRLIKNPKIHWDLTLQKFAARDDLLGGNHWHHRVHSIYADAIYDRLTLE